MIYTVHSNKILLLILIVTSPVFLFLISYYGLPEKLGFIKRQSDVYDVLIDYKGFKFIINPNICLNNTKDPFVLVTVPSAVDNLDFRKAIRTTWGQWEDHYKVVFFIGIPQYDFGNLSRDIHIESQLFGDIVQGNFIDSYRNMSYKHMMMLKWAKYHCAEAKYVVRVDDDTIVNLPRVYNMLEKGKLGERGVIACFVHPNSSVERTYGLWNISVLEYPKPRYPRYCSGLFIIYSRDVVLKLLDASQRVPYYFVDDVYVTGLLAKEIGVKPTILKKAFVNVNITKMLLTDPTKLHGGPYIIGPMVQDPRNIREIWLALLKYNFKVAKDKLKEDLEEALKYQRTGLITLKRNKKNSTRRLRTTTLDFFEYF